MLGQIRALVELRLLLLKRVWFRSAAGAVAGVLLVLIVAMLALAALGVGIGLFFAGWRVFADADSLALVLAVDAMVFAAVLGWGAGLLTEIQRSDAIDFRKMLYLPVSLSMVFLLNFVASLASPLTLFFGLGALGFVSGLVLGAGPRMFGALLLAGAFYLMLAAWSYHIRGLLAILMENKRRRRLILTLIPLVIIAVAQLPQILVHLSRNSAEANRADPSSDADGAAAARPSGTSIDTLARRLTLANGVVPLGWLPLGVAALREDRYGAVALCLVGMTGLAGAGLAAGYRSTRRHYTGFARRGKEKVRPRAAAARRSAPPLTARTLPFLPDDTAALAWAGVLSLLRHPTVRVQLLMPVFIVLVIMLPIAFGAPGSSFPAPSFLIAFFVYVVMINAAMLLINIFGLDPEGFQALVLLPTDRRQYFVAMNLAFFLPVVVQSLLFAVAGGFIFRPGLITIVVLLLQFLQAYVSLCVGGNFISIYFPVRAKRDALSGRKGRPSGLVGALLAVIGVPLLMLPTIVAFAVDQVAARWLPPIFAPLGIVLSLAFLGLSILVYRQCLPALGRRLQAREQEILLALRRDKD